MSLRDDLLASVYARPEEDAPRLIFADWLQARHEPRGEFIALQVRRGRGFGGSAREDALLRGHEHEWLDALGGCALPHGTRYERGFACELALASGWKAFAGHPAWRTIRVLDVSAIGAEADMTALLTSAECAGLLRLYGVATEQLSILSGARRGLGWRSLKQVRYRDGADLLRTLRDLHCLPALTELELMPRAPALAPGELAELITAAALGIVESLQVPVLPGGSTAADYATVLRRAPRSLRAVRLVQPGAEISLQRMLGGQWLPDLLASLPPPAPSMPLGPRNAARSTHPIAPPRREPTSSRRKRETPRRVAAPKRIAVTPEPAASDDIEAFLDAELLERFAALERR